MAEVITEGSKWVSIKDIISTANSRLLATEATGDKCRLVFDCLPLSQMFYSMCRLCISDCSSPETPENFNIPSRLSKTQVHTD